jgi:hypothetical protein
MRNRTFSLILAALLLILPSGAQADLSIAKEVEEQKVHFNSSEFQLSPDSKIILDQAISLLARMNESYSIKVMGFTDAKGPEEINQDLSMQRANTVASYLISKGIDRNRVLIQGLGRESPVATNDTDEGRQLNRRVEFKFINPDTSNLQLTASTQLVAATTNAPKEEEILVITPAPEAPAPEKEQAPVAESKPEIKKEAAPSPLQKEEVVERSPAVLSERRKDTMLAPEKKRKSPYYADHIYEDRKRSEAGQTYVQLSPILMTLDGLSGLGAGDDRASSQISFHGEAGWISFLDESFESYVVAKGYGSFLRFGQDAANNFGSKQKEYTFGGELGIGRYFHPSVALQVQAGYGSELIYQTAGTGIELDNDFIGHAGISAEAVVWRFSKQGDIGFDVYLNYYDIGRGILESGTGYGMDVFVDYDFLRAGLGFSLLNLETTTRDFNQWQFGPTFRLYF